MSYSLYAIHEPVCLFVRSVFFHGAQSSNILLALPVMGACVLVAAGLFFLVERSAFKFRPGSAILNLIASEFYTGIWRCCGRMLPRRKWRAGMVYAAMKTRVLS